MGPDGLIRRAGRSHLFGVMARGSPRETLTAHANVQGRSNTMPLLAVSTGAGVLFGAIYIVLLITLGIIAIRKGHWVMFIIGIFIPLFWIIGALLPPTRGADAI
jgi:hypothetical protein